MWHVLCFIFMHFLWMAMYQIVHDSRRFHGVQTVSLLA
jgi:hypothetical protein